MQARPHAEPIGRSSVFVSCLFACHVRGEPEECLPRFCYAGFVSVAHRRNPSTLSAPIRYVPGRALWPRSCAAGREGLWPRRPPPAPPWWNPRSAAPIRVEPEATAACPSPVAALCRPVLVCGERPTAGPAAPPIGRRYASTPTGAVLEQPAAKPLPAGRARPSSSSFPIANDQSQDRHPTDPRATGRAP